MKRSILVAVLVVGVALQSTVQAQSQKDAVGDYLYEIIKSEGVEDAIAEYRELKEMEAERYDLRQAQLNKLGYRLLNEHKEMAAIAIFKLNTESFPESINVWDSLGEGYLALGENEMAARNYRKVLEMLKADTALNSRQKKFMKLNAETKLFEAENFDPASDKILHYVSYHGGIPAGKWDMKNVSEFKKNTGTKISYAGNNLYLSPVPGNVESNLKGENPADVSTGFIAGDYRRLIEKGLIADISSLWKEEEWDKVFPESFKKMASYKGKQYFVPMAFQWNPIWYQKDIFEKHDLTPPKTWEELLELCDRLNELGYAPFSISVQNWPPPINRWFTILNLRINGPEFHDRVMRGEVAFTDNRIRDVFMHWRELFRHDAFVDSSFQNNYRKGVGDFVSGKAVMYNLGEWIYESPPVKQMEAKLDFFAFPEMNPDVKKAEIVHAYGAFMRAGNAKPEVSEELLKWLASSNSQQSNVKANNRVVANMNVPQSLYSDVQKRIISHIRETNVLVPLLEMNTKPEFAQKAMAVFQEYWKQPENIDAAMIKLEEARKEVFNFSEKTAAGMNSSCMENEMKRQFDFWVGEWDVYEEGKKVSESRIDRTLDGCMILENYTSLRMDYAGKSINYYDVKKQQWVQIWTDTQGNVRHYSGEFTDGKMHLEGTNISRNGEESKVRMLFTPKPDGSVRQLYEQSTDGGETWHTVFDGLYKSKTM